MALLFCCLEHFFIIYFLIFLTYRAARMWILFTSEILLELLMKNTIQYRRQDSTIVDSSKCFCWEVSHMIETFEFTKEDLHNFWMWAPHVNLESIVRPRHFELFTTSICLLLVTCLRGPTKWSREIKTILHLSGWMVSKFLQE